MSFIPSGTTSSPACSAAGSAEGQCTAIPSNQLQANASATYKATAVGGTATLDVGMLEWPLTSVEVLNAADAQVFQVTSATYADMGGGDAFAYAADGTPHYYYAQM